MCDAYVIRICSDILQGTQDREEPLTEKQSEEETMRTHSVFGSVSTAEKREPLVGSVWALWDDVGRVSRKDNGKSERNKPFNLAASISVCVQPRPSFRSYFH